MSGAAPGRWSPLDHTGDVGIEAEAPDAPALFACCASAMFDILAGEGRWRASSRREVSLEAPDLEILLVRWLRELLYLHDTERWVFTEFDVRLEEAPPGWRLEGEARGEIFDPSRGSLRTELKAVTYHQLEARRHPDGAWRARLVFDI